MTPRGQPIISSSPAVGTDYDPVLVAAPTIRSGTTLVQRLLCSSPRALIYGETCAQDILVSMNLHAARLAMFLQNRDGLNRALNGVLAGNVNNFIAHLTPDVDGYLEALGQSAFGWLGFCRSYAAQMGRPVWGFKYPGWGPAEIDMIRRFLPCARWIYIYRNVADCARSAKAMGRLQSEQDVQAFCQVWRANLIHILNWGAAPHLLLVRYTDLIDKRAETLRRIAEFTGAHNMDQTVLDYKINAVGDSLKEDYITPVNLTDVECRFAAEASAELPSLLWA